MDKLLPQLYKEYGLYSNFRNFPLDLDGLKPVERRVLISAYKIARDKLVKSRQVDAYTIGHYHPHGECYGTIVQLVRQGFLEGQGNFGTTYGVEPIGPAAPRYTECKINKKTLDLAFKYVDYVDWQESELNDKEPVYLPVKYPLCLLGKEYTQGIGFGFKTYVPCYAEEDLKRRLMWLLKIKKTKPTIAPITDCEIISPPKDLEELLTIGKARIEVRGKLMPYPSQNKVVLKSWPPGRRFESILNKFSEELESGMIGFTDASVTSTEIVFEVLRERNREKIYNDFIEKLKEVITGAIPFETIVSDLNANIKTKSIDSMLIDTHKMFLDVNVNVLKENIKRLNNLIDEYEILEKMRPYLVTCIKSNHSVEQTISTIEEFTRVPKSRSLEIINKYKISKLLELRTDTKELKDALKVEKEKLGNVEEHTINQY